MDEIEDLGVEAVGYDEDEGLPEAVLPEPGEEPEPEIIRPPEDDPAIDHEAVEL